ncbi:Pro-neuregulin-1, membrane-bound isoform isoform X3 [Aix galericulata]|nr:Pro-neuregulin-1, membrane-bound isoform isoform X3 [Aix galericulata]
MAARGARGKGREGVRVLSLHGTSTRSQQSRAKASSREDQLEAATALLLHAWKARACAVPPKLKEMKNQEVAVGQKLVLRCETTSEYPALRFKWLKNGKEITKKTKPDNVKIPKKQKKYSELHIYRATLADAGEYACRVSSKLGNDSTKASVIITDTNGLPFY